MYLCSLKNKIIMADGYLESRYDEVFGAKGKKVVVKRISIDSLLERNRSHRGFRKEHVVTEEALKKIVAVNAKIPSAKNQQVFRFKLVTKETGADKVLANIKLGGMLPELHLPFEGTEPEAFIIVCSTVPESKLVDIDLGIALQSMSLKAVDMGLNGLIIGAFNKGKITEEFGLPYEPLAILAIGSGAETIRLVPIGADESRAYYRNAEGVHFVPKVRPEELVIP